MKKLYSIDDLFPYYDLYLLDLWGVIHDGRALYPGVEDTINSLLAAGKEIIFISNGPRRSEKVIPLLKKFAIWRENKMQVVTAGEVFVQTVLQGKLTLPGGDKLSKYFYVGEEKDRDILSIASLEEASLEEADFMLITGYEEDLSSLEAAKRRDLPAICVNPDIIVVRQTGEKLYCAGKTAEEYEKLGGRIYYFGKPYQNIYDYALSIATRTYDKSKIVAIGDNLDTDIQGAKSYQISSVLVTGGIYQNRLNLENTPYKADYYISSFIIRG